MRLRLKTDAATEPVSQADFQAFARIDTDPGDGVMAMLVSAARRRVEKETGLALLTQTWVGIMDRWPATRAPDYRARLTGDQPLGVAPADLWWDGMREGPISMLGGTGALSIPKRPFQSLTSINVTMMDGTKTTVPATSYYISTDSYIGRIGRYPGTTWPVPRVPLGGIEIEFKVGFGDDPASIPDDLLIAVKMLAAHWHENREPVVQSQFTKLPNHIGGILASWKLPRLL